MADCRNVGVWDLYWASLASWLSYHISGMFTYILAFCVGKATNVSWHWSYKAKQIPQANPAEVSSCWCFPSAFLRPRSPGRMPQVTSVLAACLGLHWVKRTHWNSKRVWTLSALLLWEWGFSVQYQAPVISCMQHHAAGSGDTDRWNTGVRNRLVSDYSLPIRWEAGIFLLLALLQPLKGPGLSVAFCSYYLFTQDMGIEIMTGLKWRCSLE